jgi:hypothetical protein
MLKRDTRRQLPAGLSGDVARSRLMHVYEMARALPITNAQLLRTGEPRAADEHAAAVKVALRLGTLDESALIWLRDAPRGTIRFHTPDPGMSTQHTNRSVMMGSAGQRLSFDALPPRMPPLPSGRCSVHVDVGFTDLSSLAWSCAKLPAAHRSCNPAAADGDGNDLACSDGWDAGGFGETAEQEPQVCVHRWVGVDTSPYVIAKTLVIAHMLRTGSHVDAILQVRECKSACRCMLLFQRHDCISATRRFYKRSCIPVCRRGLGLWPKA